MSQGSLQVVSGIFKGVFSRVFQGIFNGVLRKFKGQERLYGYFKKFTMNIERCFKGVLREF